jgi:GNAT superfamily N-acetyltransferase
MPAYRFCRTDDVELLARAHDVCYAPHFPGLPPLGREGLKRAMRELGLWCSSSMVATDEAGPVAVLLAAKRETETLLWRLGVRPDRLREGHGRHLVTSLADKLAILGPPRMVAEVPRERREARALLETCGFREHVRYADHVLVAAARSPAGSGLPIPVTVDDLVANESFPAAGPRAWERAPATLLARRERLAGLAVASAERIEAWVLGGESDDASERLVAGFDCAEASQRELWLGLLFRELAASDPRRLRIPRLHPAEVPTRLLEAWGFEPADVTIGYARDGK